MAQASSSAQREPSMEEILASIRRIIEDSDAAGAAPANKQTERSETAYAEAARKAEESEVEVAQSVGEETKDIAGAATAETQQEIESDGSPTLAEVTRDTTSGTETGSPTGKAGSLADVLREVTSNHLTAPAEQEAQEHAQAEMDAVDDEVRTFREELLDSDTDVPDEDTAARDHDAPAEDESMNALSMADIQAQVAGQRYPVEAGDADTSDGEKSNVEEPDTGQIDERASDPAVEEADDTDNAYAADYGEYEDDFATAAAATPPDAVAGSSAIAMNRPAAGDQYPSRTPIISEHAGRQVAAAFDELSEAFSHTKKFDQMAEEMMRAMLQDWLDNNLPTLVERLVREEIDRVARGASR